MTTTLIDRWLRRRGMTRDDLAAMHSTDGGRLSDDEALRLIGLEGGSDGEGEGGDGGGESRGIDLDALAAKLAPLIDSSVDKRIGAVAKQFGERVDGLKQSIANLKPPASEDPPSDDPPADGGKVSPELAALKRQQAELQRKLEEANAAREQERKDAARSRAETAAREALDAAGVRKELIGDRIAAMWASGELALTDDLQPVVMGAPAYEGGDPQPLPVADGIAAWAKTDAAAVYRPAREGSGSGGRPGETATGHKRGLPRGKDGRIDMSKVRKPAPTDFN